MTPPRHTQVSLQDTPYYHYGHRRFARAFDVFTGSELWSNYLPGTAQSTPMSYLGPKSKRQIIVLTVPNATRRFGIQQAGDDDRDKLDPDGGQVIAYSVQYHLAK